MLTYDAEQAAYDVEGCGAGACAGINRMTYDARIPTRSMWEHYLPTFHACLVEAEAMHSMCSYNSINSVPTCASDNLMNGLVRNSWNWTGFIVSDYDAYAQVYTQHKYTKTLTEAAAVGLNAGLDQEGGGTTAIAQLQAAIDAKLTDASTVATAFRRLMRARLMLGMFDPPTLSSFGRIGASSLRTAASTALNRRAAQEGITLMKNGVAANGRPLLPLNLSSFLGQPGSIFVSGPLANNAPSTLGNYDCGYNDWNYSKNFDPLPGCVNNHTSMVGGLVNGGNGLTGGEVVFSQGCSSSDCVESNFSKLGGPARRASL
jgi:beta-glucosidase-like glycosyl hydrolase